MDRDAAPHARARAWLEAAFSGTEPVGLPWIVVLAFVRITTRAGIQRRPLPLQGAIAYVDEWLALPNVSSIDAGPRHWTVLRRLLVAAGTAGNLSSDAHLAAMALERGAVLCSTDNDFRRFPGLEYVNPLT